MMTMTMMNENDYDGTVMKENLSVVIPALLNGLTENGKSRVVPPALWQCWPHLV